MSNYYNFSKTEFKVGKYLHYWFEQTNQVYIRVIDEGKNVNIKRLGASLIYSPMTPPSMKKTNKKNNCLSIKF